MNFKYFTGRGRAAQDAQPPGAAQPQQRQGGPQVGRGRSRGAPPPQQQQRQQQPATAPPTELLAKIELGDKKPQEERPQQRRRILGMRCTF